MLNDIMGRLPESCSLFANSARQQETKRRKQNCEVASGTGRFDSQRHARFGLQARACALNRFRVKVQRRKHVERLTVQKRRG